MHPGGLIHPLPDHGAVLELTRDGQTPLILVLDLDRGLLHVLHVGAEPFEGRQQLQPLQRAAWSERLRHLGDHEVEGSGALGRLRWASPGASGSAPLGPFQPTLARGVAGVARDLLRFALRSGVDHPLAVQALGRWNTALGVEPTVAFADGRPRRIRLVGVVDRAGQRNLEALLAVLKPDEPLIADVTACSSFGAWDPAGLVARHTVAWVGARIGIADRLRDMGVPREALHRSESMARAWLRGD